MNDDIASLVATRPEQARTMRINQVLNDMNAGLRQARKDFPTDAARARSAEMTRQLRRAATRLQSLGIEA